MKQLIFTCAVGVMLLNACKDSPKKVDASTELEALKKQKSDLQDKIAKLEDKIGKKDSVKVTKIITTSITPIMFRNYISVQGRLDAEQSVLATSEAPGIISSIYVSNGQYVHRGQTLATLKTETVNTGIIELDQQIEFAKILYDKQKRLWEQEIGTEVQLLSAKNNYEALLKRKSSVITQKKLFTIVAPINGMIDNMDLKVGQMMAPGMMGIKIVNTSALNVKANIPENYVSKVSIGDDAMIIIPDAHDSLLSRVNYVSASIDPASRTFNAEFRIPSSSRLKPNMVALIKIVGYKNDRAFVLPAGVIQNTLDGKIVFVEENGVAKQRVITVGENYEGKIEILSGLNLGDNVITTGFEDLNDGDRVEKQIIN